MICNTTNVSNIKAEITTKLFNSTKINNNSIQLRREKFITSYLKVSDQLYKVRYVRITKMYLAQYLPILLLHFSILRTAHD